MCNIVAVGLLEKDLKYLSILGDYWECGNESIISINPELKWNWVLTIDSECSCNFFNLEKNRNVRNNFMKLSSLITQIVIYNHQTAGDQNKDKIEISPIKNISISELFRFTAIP
jgi:hypothetical protein